MFLPSWFAVPDFVSRVTCFALVAELFLGLRWFCATPSTTTSTPPTTSPTTSPNYFLRFLFVTEEDDILSYAANGVYFLDYPIAGCDFDKGHLHPLVLRGSSGLQRVEEKNRHLLQEDGTDEPQGGGSAELDWKPSRYSLEVGGGFQSR